MKKIPKLKIFLEYSLLLVKKKKIENVRYLLCKTLSLIA